MLSGKLRQMQEKLFSNPTTINIWEHMLHFGIISGMETSLCPFHPVLHELNGPAVQAGMISREEFPVGNIIAFGNNYRGHGCVQIAYPTIRNPQAWTKTNSTMGYFLNSCQQLLTGYSVSVYSGVFKPVYVDEQSETRMVTSKKTISRCNLVY